MREERKEKREDPCGNHVQLKYNCTATGFALARVEQQRQKREERREKKTRAREEGKEKREEKREQREGRSEQTETSTMKMSGPAQG